MNLDNHIIFLLSILPIVLVLSFKPAVSNSITSFIQKISSRGLSSDVNELPKFAIIRILFGFVIAIRGYEILAHLTLADYSNHFVLMIALLNFIAGLLLIFGFITQIALLYLIFFQWLIGDVYLYSQTLANDIAAILSVLLVFTNSGKRLSLDGLLLKKIQYKYLNYIFLYFKTTPTETTITIAKFIALFSYWCVCCYSVVLHFNEHAWTSGIAGPLLLSNNFMSSWHATFTDLFIHSSTAVYLAKISIWMMMGWYGLVLPFVLLGGIWRKYIIVWGLLFFVLSRFVLELSWLSEVEFLLWAGLFWTKLGISGKQHIEVAYDDKCSLCDTTVRFIRAVDVFDKVKLRPVSENHTWLKTHNISVEQAMFDLYGVDNKSGKIFSGYDLYLNLSKQIVLLWPFFPVLLVGKWLKIGPLIYRWIAFRRTQMFGVCVLPSPKRPIFIAVEDVDVLQNKVISIALLHVTLLGGFYLSAIPVPSLNIKGDDSKLGAAAQVYGIAPINVFNHTDLRMAENWFTLRDITHGGNYLIPLISERGEKLPYHKSDRVAYGYTVGFKRWYIGESGCFYNQYKTTLDYLVLVYLHKEKLDGTKRRFKYTQYFQALPGNDALLQNRYIPNPITEPCELEFEIQ